MKYLNLGCGRHFHLDWTNVDFTSTGDGVIAWDLTQGIPFPDASFDVVYNSHVLEHFPKTKAKSFLEECCRVLRPQGTIRIVVPDLEQITKTYLRSLEQASSGSQEWSDNYNWILLEMYDQTVRNHSGGEMLAYFFKEHIPNPEFILQRLGGEAKNLFKARECNWQEKDSISNPKSKLRQMFKNVYRFMFYPGYHRESMLRLLLGKEYEALQIGRFRKGGEIHQWMYDRYSLALLLEEYGLEKIVQRTASQSYISNWTNFNLDTESDGSIYKPDSLFMEAIKPAK